MFQNGNSEHPGWHLKDTVMTRPYLTVLHCTKSQFHIVNMSLSNMTPNLIYPTFERKDYKDPAGADQPPGPELFTWRPRPVVWGVVPLPLFQCILVLSSHTQQDQLPDSYTSLLTSGLSTQNNVMLWSISNSHNFFNNGLIWKMKKNLAHSWGPPIPLDSLANFLHDKFLHIKHFTVLVCKTLILGSYRKWAFSTVRIGIDRKLSEMHRTRTIKMIIVALCISDNFRSIPMRTVESAQFR